MLLRAPVEKRSLRAGLFQHGNLLTKLPFIRSLGEQE